MILLKRVGEGKVDKRKRRKGDAKKKVTGGKGGRRGHAGQM